MTEHKPILSIIIPVYNEAGSLYELDKRLSKTLQQISNHYEIIWVDDNSKDESLFIIKQLAEENKRNKYISFSRNFGHQKAITAGLDFCSGEAVVIMDGDLQDPPELIPELWQKYQEGYKVVYAKRKARKGETFFKKLTAKLFYRLLKNTTRINIPVDTGDFRLIDRKVVEYLKQMHEQHKFLRGQIAWIGFKQTFVTYNRESRFAGKTNFSFIKMLRFAIDGITAFSNYPLRFATAMGFAVSFIAFIIILYALYSKFVLQQVITGWTSIIISTMFIGGIQLLTIGIIGEYIIRMNSDIRNRPLYVVEEENLSNPEK